MKGDKSSSASIKKEKVVSVASASTAKPTSPPETGSAALSTHAASSTPASSTTSVSSKTEDATMRNSGSSQTLVPGKASSGALTIVSTKATESEEINRVVLALWGLAEHHAKRTKHFEAITCLEAIIQAYTPSPTQRDGEGPASSKLLVLVEVRTRVRLAELLLRHTHCIGLAKAHLDRSLLLIGETTSPQSVDLKLRTFHYLALIHTDANTGSQLRLAKQIVKNATTVASTHLKTDWYYHFLLFQSQLLCNERNLEEALSVLQPNPTPVDDKDKLVFLIARAHIALMQHDQQQTWVLLNTCRETVGRLRPRVDYMSTAVVPRAQATTSTIAATGGTATKLRTDRKSVV
eukprot:TRINITY_DN3144_c0_g1_i1.p1 TRINITY_DN3144_c0_g1~~TRINITY_DN3144_c0_g1_i1.p1  ORF type:complete len:349 (-),score=98.24 TRINITY_DN3144_c0_g1_i1:120-1166(-)